MVLYQIRLLVSLLVLHRSLAFLNNDDPDPVETFQLTVTPAQVNRHTTDKMTLHCERNPKVKTEIDQMFTMRIAKQSKTGWSVVAEQRFAETSPRVEGNVTASSQLTGDISNVFLQVTWDSIEKENFGKYMCDVMGADINYNVVKENSSEVDIYEAKIPIDYFVVLSQKTHKMTMELKETVNTEIPGLKQSVADLKTEMPSLKSEVGDLKTEIPSLKSEVGGLKNEIPSLKSEVGDLKTEIPSLNKRLETLELFLGGLTKWPGGFYGLLQPKTGCPVDLAFFGGTHKFHKIHTDYSRSGHYSSVLPSRTAFEADKKYFISLGFCEVTKPFNTARWPQGSFCINRIVHQPCPTGFSEGTVQFDAEDDDPTNEGRNNVVDDYGGAHIRLSFCCQDSGSASVPIQLPTSSPFLLYRYGGACQAVQGMSVSEEVLKVDTEDDDNADRLYGKHPDVDQPGTSIKLYLCYYVQK